jgi:hypothetical protein
LLALLLLLLLLSLLVLLLLSPLLPLLLCVLLLPASWLLRTSCCSHVTLVVGEGIHNTEH